jgi:FkbM family methyltransferase
MKSFQIKDIFYILLRIRKILIKKDILNLCFNRYRFKRFGTDYGSWVIVPDIDNKSIVYSIGIGNDLSFDIDLINNFNVPIFAYDPTPKCIEWLKNQKLPSQFIFMPIGLASFDGEIKFNLPESPDYISASITVHNKNSDYFIAPVNRLLTLMKYNQHTYIDLLKIDIEGAEYEVIKDVISSGIMIKQLLIEFHHRFQEIGISQTITAIKNLEKYGYKLIYVNQKTGEEYTFIKL